MCKRIIISTFTALILGVLLVPATLAQAGGAKNPPPPPAKVSPIRAAIVYTGTICRDLPLPTPRRFVGFGKRFNPFYTPTYTYPSAKSYAGDTPRYYPFFLPRLWPNYKAAPVYKKGDYGYPSRSGHYWDSYDEWNLEKNQQRQ